MPIRDAKFVKSGIKTEHFPTADRAEIAMIGRSNVGKSSLINALCKRKNLAQTGPKPGKTQLINFFDVDVKKNNQLYHLYLVDLPGYGYAKVSKEKRAGFEDMIVDYLTQRENLEHIFVLIDSNIPPQAIDIEFVEWIAGASLAYSIVFTKSDKPKQKDLNQHIKNFFVLLQQKNITLPEYYVTNAIKLGAVEELEDYIESLV